MTSKPLRIRGATAATCIGLTMFGGTYLFSGIPAAHADPSTYTCSSTTGGTSSNVTSGQKHVFKKEGFTCIKNP
jgi:hypothetical protein